MNQANLKVLPHGPIQKLFSNIWMVTGSVSRGPVPRNMVIVRTANQKLVVHSAVLLHEEAMKELSALGTVHSIIVPSPLHRMDAKAYQTYFPSASVLCPRAIEARVAEKVIVQGYCEEELPKLGITVHQIPGIKHWELAYEVPINESETVLIVTDCLMNLPHFSGAHGMILKWVGSTGFFGITNIGKLILLKNRTLFRDWLQALSKRTSLKGVLVAHGEPILNDISFQLIKAAERL